MARGELFGTTFACLFELFEQPRRALAVQRSHHVSFALFLAELHVEFLRAKLCRLRALGLQPAAIQLARERLTARPPISRTATPEVANLSDVRISGFRMMM